MPTNESTPCDSAAVQPLTRYLAALSGSQQDRLVTAFCDERRRHVLRILLDGSASVEYIARRVLEAEGVDPPVTQDRIEAVAISLYHVHLPKLDATGFVSFDHECQLVAPEWALPAVAPCLVSRPPPEVDAEPR